MYGNWMRVSPAELDQARGDLDRAYDLAETARNDEDPGRWLASDKAWQALDFLLTRRGVRTPIVHGAEDFADDDVDWGYGRPRYLTPAQVATAADELAALTEEDLIQGVDPAELSRADIYPDLWDSVADLTWVAHFLPSVQQFFAAAAKSGDAVLCWLD
jgi:hypothetical protein